MMVFLAGLACFRLTRLITDDKIFAPLRRVVSRQGKKAKEGITCPWCVSFYFATIIAGYIYWRWIPYDMAVLCLFAIWGMSILWNGLFTFLVTYSKDI